ncbi:MAG: rod shape-determining protein MreD [Ruminococcaceae bacterium]|nr:rod shape-determining protein MreD [Oscillospiraceae bacterium]
MKNVKVFRYLAYAIEILLLFVLGSTPSLLPTIYGATPCLLLALSLTIAVFEPPVESMIFGIACGVLTDLGFSNSIGTFTIGLAIVCFALGFCANNFISANFLNVMITAVVVVSALLSIHFVFAILIKGYDDASSYFVNHYISRIVQTILCTAVLYFVNNFIFSTLNEER